MNRRGFLGSILALGAAPAIVRADALMRIVPRDATVIAPEVGRITTFEFYESSNHAADAMAWALIMQEALRIAHDKATFISGLNPHFKARLSKFEQAGTIRYRRQR